MEGGRGLGDGWECDSGMRGGREREREGGANCFICIGWLE